MDLIGRLFLSGAASLLETAAKSLEPLTTPARPRPARFRDESESSSTQPSPIWGVSVELRALIGVGGPHLSGGKLYFKYNFDLAPISPPRILFLQMQFSAYSDYALRVLIQAALRQPERITVNEVAETFGISRNHLVKIVHDLGRNGYLQTQRGGGGGFTLALPASEIRLGDVARMGEKETVIECMDRPGQPCRLFPVCRLKGVLDEAATAFFEVLDRYTIADLVKHPSKLRAVLQM